jgi:hypothetical protein
MARATIRYLFWLDVLNNKMPGNYRGMVCDFSSRARNIRTASAPSARAMTASAPASLHDESFAV